MTSVLYLSQTIFEMESLFKIWQTGKAMQDYKKHCEQTSKEELLMISRIMRRELMNGETISLSLSHQKQLLNSFSKISKMTCWESSAHQLWSLSCSVLQQKASRKDGLKVHQFCWPSSSSFLLLQPTTTWNKNNSKNWTLLPLPRTSMLSEEDNY